MASPAFQRGEKQGATSHESWVGRVWGKFNFLISIAIPWRIFLFVLMMHESHTQRQAKYQKFSILWTGKSQPKALLWIIMNLFSPFHSSRAFFCISVSNFNEMRCIRFILSPKQKKNVKYNLRFRSPFHWRPSERPEKKRTRNELKKKKLIINLWNLSSFCFMLSDNDFESFADDKLSQWWCRGTCKLKRDLKTLRCEVWKDLSFQYN